MGKRREGVVTCVRDKPAADGGMAACATIVLSDFRAERLEMSWSAAQEFLIALPGPARKRARTARAHPLEAPLPRPAAERFRPPPGAARTPAPKAWQAPPAPGNLAEASLRDTRSDSGSDGDSDWMPAAERSDADDDEAWEAEAQLRGRAKAAPKAAAAAAAARRRVAADPAPDIPRQGEALAARIAEVAAAGDQRWPPGTRLWVKLRGLCRWPVAAWAFALCRRHDTEQLLQSHRPGRLLVIFYGDHSTMWVRPEEVEADEDPGAVELDASIARALRAWGRQRRKPQLAEVVIEEAELAEAEARAEAARLQAAMQTPPDALDACDLCREDGARLSCAGCQRMLHPLCLLPPALAATDLPGSRWTCPCCGEANLVGEAEDTSAEAEEVRQERMGLTPDWLIDAACFTVFQLPRPTPECPYVKGLLDPCTNSLAAPNIPAEVLYDKQMNGLLLSNSWAGYHMLLNPDYKAAVQWRFVNRAIDEVENDSVPAVLLVCRNSTDTAYFQRLRPYPRVLLRRQNARFKDYDKTPIGFGIVVFCIAKAPCTALYERFFDGFAAAGEPNIPIDRQLMAAPAFYDLLSRLRQHAEEHQRDHWILCSTCGLWRIIAYEAMLEVRGDAEWTCAQLRPPYTSCATPQSKREAAGARYATGGAESTAADAQTLSLTMNPAAAAAASSRASFPLAGARAGRAVPEGEWQVLTAIEMARNARIAANRAYLGALLGPAVPPPGVTAALEAGRPEPAGPAYDPLVLVAARELARKAALAEAVAQADRARRGVEAGGRARAREAARLARQLAAVQAEDAAAGAALAAAEAALATLQAGGEL
ncbi:hypothetical protein WJX81_004826 [Elliptochloris bilobata]|uniref:PHD-type domain-containing protein n=1 Tax=Elliptochloris bilobata TaxID=381761 RepID=A0AAW1RKB4_9CHLO